MKTRIQTCRVSNLPSFMQTLKRICLCFSCVALLLICLSAQGQSLGDALNATNLTWTTSGTGGAQGWSVETTTTHDGVSAAQSATLSIPGRTSVLQTTVTGPGTLSFWWSNPSQQSTLTFSVGTSTLASIIIYPSWQQQTFYLGPGSQTLKWTFSFTSSPSDSLRGYVDQVSYTAGATAPLMTLQPSSQSQVPGINTTFTVSAGGTPPLSYQWQLNSTNIDGATNASFTVTNTKASNLGYYNVVVSNSVDSIISSNATLEFGQITGWGSPYSGDTMISPGATNVSAIAAGNYSSLALKSDGTFSGWGLNVFGQTTIPADLTNVIAIAAGSSHSLALKSDGTVTVWGSNSSGQTNVPMGLSNVVAIAAGASHSVALKSDGTVVAWGSNLLGQTNVPAGLTNVVAISAARSFNYSLALKADRTVVMWGWGPAVPTNLVGTVAIAAGGGFALALLNNGTINIWGQNTYGETNVPVGLMNVVGIAAGAFHSLALLADGTVVAWGFNNNGQTNVPTALAHVVSVAAGSFHNLAVVGNGPPVVSAPIFNPTLSGDGFTLLLPSQCGRVYALEYKNSLTDSNWVALPLVAGNGTNLVLIDPTATDSQRVYRVRRW